MPLEREKEAKTLYLHMLVLIYSQVADKWLRNRFAAKVSRPKSENYRHIVRKIFGADKTLFATNRIVEKVWRPGNASQLDISP